MYPMVDSLNLMQNNRIPAAKLFNNRLWLEKKFLNSGCCHGCCQFEFLQNKNGCNPVIATVSFFVVGADDGNRTHNLALGRPYFTTKLHPQDAHQEPLYV